MKVLISNPPWFVPHGSVRAAARRMGIRAGSRWPYTVRISKGYFPFPFNMAYADAYLKKMEIKSTFRDSILLQENYEEYFKLAAGFDYVAIETSAASWENDRHVARVLAAQGSHVILVGMHATAFAAELIELEEVFAVLKGEYEQSLYNCVSGGQPGVYTFNEWEDIDDAPFPTRDESTYKYKTPRHPLALNMWASRGCPFQCTFCYVSCFQQQIRYRPHSPKRIGQEIENVLSRLPKIQYIYFDDDTFNIGDQRVQEISKVMKFIGLPWGAMCRVDTSSLETFQVMKDSGCREVKIGIESGSQRILDDIIKKSLNLEAAKKKVKAIKAMGLRVHCAYMYGFPTETQAELEATKRVMGELQSHSRQYSRLGLLSGTPLWKDFEKTHNRAPTAAEADGVLLRDRHI